MKLQRFARTAKKSGYCVVFTCETPGDTDEMIISNGYGVYRCGCIPPMIGKNQICALLDIDEKKREKMQIKEETYASLSDIACFDLTDGEVAGETDTESVNIGIIYEGKEYSVLKTGDGELLFFNRELLAPLANDMQSPYFKLRSRIAHAGSSRQFRYLIAKDGFTTLAALLPVNALSENFMKDLHDFVSDCDLQKQLEDNRKKD